jgi:hypothetical protein
MSHEAVTIELESALRALARSQKGPFKLFAYGLRRHPDGDSDDLAMRTAIGRSFPGLRAQLVLDPEDPFSPASIRKGFRDDILGALERREGSSEPVARAPEPSSSQTVRQSRDRLAAVMAELPALLDDVDRLFVGGAGKEHVPSPAGHAGVTIAPETVVSGRPPVAPAGRSSRPEATAAPLLFVSRLEDLGSDAESVAEALAQVVLRRAHLFIPGGPLDTRLAEGRAGLTLALRLGAIRGRRARERSLRDLDRRRTEMRVYGPIPYGFTKDGKKLSPVRDELAVVKRILDLGALRRSSLEIASRLNDERLAWKDGSPWTWRRVHQVLRNPLYPSILKGAIS